MDSVVVSEFEGGLLNDPDPFSYFMLIAFEASGLIRFALLLALWPVIRLFEICRRSDIGLKLMIFVATAGLPYTEIEVVARAVLPKFYIDDVNMGRWRAFCSHNKRVVVTKMPRIMVGMFAKEHLRANEVIGRELIVNRFGFATGFVDNNDVGSTGKTVADIFGSDEQFISLCKEESNPSLDDKNNQEHQTNGPVPVIFHDGRLVKRPTPLTALIILLWIPLGIILATIRIIVGMFLPMWVNRHLVPFFGGGLIVKGTPPPPVSSSSTSGVLFVCTHRTLMDPIVLSTVLQRRLPAVTYSLSRISEILSPIRTVRLTRIRDVDAQKIKNELEKGDLVVCPEGTTCREPFLLRFSALFAELTDRIVPVGMNYRVGFFHATTARGWKAMDPIFFFMNPRPVYEVTFLNQLPVEDTCSSGKSPHDVANYVQRILAATLGFECTNFTRRDKYRVLAGNDGSVSQTAKVPEFVKALKNLVGSTMFH